MNPLDARLVAGVLARLTPGAGSRALDVGCGKAELLLALAERFGVHGVGVDVNAAFLAEARTRAAERGVTELIELHELDARRFRTPPESFDLGACIGATHAYGGVRETLAALGALVRPGGHVLLGEGYWRRDPDPAYLDALGAAREDFVDHEGNVALGRAAGLTPIEAHASTLDDWDRYEELYADSVERFVAAHPDDPDADAMRTRIRRWRGIYATWGRETLGFGLYVFRRERGANDERPRSS